MSPSVTTWLPLTTLWRNTSVLAKWLRIPPAPPSLAGDEPVVLDPAVLFVTRVLVSVRFPPLSIPPPLLNAQARGPQNPGGITELDRTVLPVMTLFEIDTVAPAPLNGGWSSCSTAIVTPPPNVTAVSGTLVLSPPVIVMP